jgi:hypothetical protein
MAKLQRCGLILAAVAMLSVAAAINVHASEVIVTFDDLPAATLPGALVPSPYGGINWHDEFLYFGGVVSNFPPHSPPNRAYAPGLLDANFNFVTPQVFDGAWFSGPQNTANVSFNLFLGGSKVGTSSILGVTPNAVFLSSGYSGLVDQVDVITTAAGFYAMDDVTYGTSGPPPVVPEPSTFALAGMGAIALVGYGWRRRRAALS